MTPWGPYFVPGFPNFFPATVSRLSLLLWQKPWQSKAKTRQVRKKVKIKDKDTAGVFLIMALAGFCLAMIKWAIDMPIFPGVEHQPSCHFWCWVSLLKKMLSEPVLLTPKISKRHTGHTPRTQSMVYVNLHLRYTINQMQVNTPYIGCLGTLDGRNHAPRLGCRKFK